MLLIGFRSYGYAQQQSDNLMAYATIYDISYEKLMKERLERMSNHGDIIYTNWDNTSLRNATGLLHGDELKIDLRSFVMPTDSRKITSNYGPRWGRKHEGVDVKVYVGDTIVSAFDGKVRIVKNDPRGYGKYVVIRHPNGLETLYGHLSKQLVKINDEVKAGQPIGLGGNTGRSTGSHLHFEVRILGKALNPTKLFDFYNQDVTDDYYVFRAAQTLKGK